MEITATTRSFGDLSLTAETLASLDGMGYRAPTEVQAETVPRALAGKDLVVQSRTGTGKTAAFGIPVVEKVDPAVEHVQAVALTPTRELALQVAREISEIGRGRGVKVETMGQIMEYMPAERQTLLFSATVPLGIRGLIYHYLSEPEWVLLSEDQIYVKEVEHLYCLTPKLHKEATLYKLIEYENPASSMIFCNTKEETRQVHAFLAGKGLPAAMLSSDLPQKKRERVMDRFRSGEIRHLATTDVASRGIDIADLSHVFIFSTPESPEQYIHRAGRTGRVGKSGRAISLVSAHDLMNFNRLVKRYHVEVGELSVPSDEEVQARKVERIVSRLAAEGQNLPLDDFAEFAPIARRIADHEHRDRIVALLLQGHFQAPVAEDVEPEAPAPLPPPHRYREGVRRRRRR
jgi:ATP-dependent RNA helicase DeaD